MIQKLKRLKQTIREYLCLKGILNGYSDIDNIIRIFNCTKEEKEILHYCCNHYIIKQITFPITKNYLIVRCKIRDVKKILNLYRYNKRVEEKKYS